MSPALAYPPTVNELVDLYLLHVSCTPETLSLKRRRLREFLAFLGNKLYVDCRAFDLASWIGAQSWDDWTKRGACLIVQAAFNWCVKMGLTQVNPFKGVSHPEGDERRDITPQELVRLLVVSSKPFRRVVLFLWYTGLRPGELRRLDWRHLNFEVDPPLIVFPPKEHKGGRLRKKRVRRSLQKVLIPEAVEILEYLESVAKPGQAHVFASQRKARYTKRALEEQMRRSRRKAHLPEDLTLHCCRHGTGTQLGEAGYGSPIISAVLGHASSAMSDRYCHVDSKHKVLADAIRKATVLSLPPEISDSWKSEPNLFG
jgi:integrase